MALTFVKKTTVPPQGEQDTGVAAGPTSHPEQKVGPKIKFHKGDSAKKVMAQEEAKAEERAAERNRLRRFFLTTKQPDGQITFLDGKLDDEGFLDIPRYYEHNITINGERHTFACTAEQDQTQPCPICEKGDKPSLVGLMTIIDHTPYTVKSGPNAGKTYVNQRKLFVCKNTTFKLLNKLATKRGGLAGCTFDVSRSGEKAPAVGDSFDFVQKFSKLSDIAEKYSLKLEEVQPASYEEEVPYHTPEKLIELGVGKAMTGIGFEKGFSKSELADQL